MNKTQAIFESINQSLESLVEKLDSPATEATVRAFLRQSSTFHNYSFNNQFFLMMQAEARGVAISKIASFNKWKSLGASVLKGSKAFSVLHPVEYTIYERDENGEYKLDSRGRKIPEIDEETGKPRKGITFWAGPVFDVSQTNAKELGLLPELDILGHGDVSRELVDAIESEVVGALGFNLEKLEVMDSEGTYNYRTDTVTLKVGDAVSPSAELAVFFHEIGHRQIHGPEFSKGELSYERMHAERGFREGEAEAFAFALSSTFGIEKKSELYIAAWGNTSADLKERLSKISGAVKSFRESVELDKFLEKPLEVGIVPEM